MELNSSFNNSSKFIGNGTNISDAFQVSENHGVIYPVIGLFLFSLIFSEVGNICLCISLHKKQLDTMIAIFLKGITANGIIKGVFVYLPTFVAMVNGGWSLGYVGCVIQGLVRSVCDITTGALMLGLAFERYYVIGCKKNLNEATGVSKLIVLSVFIVSAIIGNLPMIRLEKYRYMNEIYACSSENYAFATALETCTEAIPALGTLVLTILSLTSLCRWGQMNRVMDFNMSTSVNGENSVVPVEGSRLSRLRGSLFPRHTENNRQDETAQSGVTSNQYKTTVALAYFNISLALMSIISFGLRSTALHMSNEHPWVAVLRISMTISLLASLMQPYILLAASTGLRKALLNFVRGRGNAVTPTFAIIGVPQCANPREDLFTINEIPDFLRPSSSMRIEVRVSSSSAVDIREACEDKNSSPDKQSNKERTDSKQSERRKSCLTSTGSGDSLFVTVGSTNDAANRRWSLSTGSVITLDLPDPYSTPLGGCQRSQITRYGSEISDDTRREKRYGIPPSKEDEIIRRHTIPLTSGNNTDAQSMTSPYHGNIKRLPCKTFLGEVLPTVLDLSSTEHSPRTSHQMSATCEIQLPGEIDSEVAGLSGNPDIFVQNATPEAQMEINSDCELSSSRIFLN